MQLVVCCFDRNSHGRSSVRKGVFRNCAKFTGKHLCQSLFFRSATLLKKRLWHRCFPANFAKFLRTPFFKGHLWWLLLLLPPSPHLEKFKDNKWDVSNTVKVVSPWVRRQMSRKWCGKLFEFLLVRIRSRWLPLFIIENEKLI